MPFIRPFSTAAKTSALSVSQLRKKSLMSKFRSVFKVMQAELNLRIGTFQMLRIKSGGRNRETKHAPKFVRSLDNLRPLTRPLFPSNCYCPIDLIGITLEVKKLPHTEREKERKKSGSFSSKGFDGIRSTIFASGAIHQRFSKLSVVSSFVNWDFHGVRKTKHSRELPALASIDISPILRLTALNVFVSL